MRSHSRRCQYIGPILMALLLLLQRLHSAILVHLPQSIILSASLTLSVCLCLHLCFFFFSLSFWLFSFSCSTSISFSLYLSLSLSLSSFLSCWVYAILSVVRSICLTVCIYVMTAKYDQTVVHFSVPAHPIVIMLALVSSGV